jgi:uncharacterized protein (TIGR02246 family)
MRSVTAIFSLIVLAACQIAGPGSRGNEQAEIQAAVAAWGAAYDSRDPSRIVSLYAPDAVLWGTSSATLRNSPEAILDYFKDAQKRPNARVRIVAQEIRLLGESAVSAGSYTFSDVRDGKPTESPARFTFVFRKADGRWMIVHHHSSRIPSP